MEERVDKEISFKTIMFRHAIRAISVFRMKYDVEFTRQAVNVSQYINACFSSRQSQPKAKILIYA